LAQAGTAETSLNVPALVDTGASQSCIDSDLAAALGLKPIDEILMAGVGGAKQHLVYLAHILIPQLDIIQWGAFAGVDLKAGGQAHRVLLGRTFLNGCILIYDGIRAQVTIASPKRM
jgi:predicted aspartyl protease